MDKNYCKENFAGGLSVSMKEMSETERPPSMDLSVWMLLFYFCGLRFAIAGPAGGEEFVLHCAGSIVYYSCR